MARPELTEDVRKLLAERITSVEQLEILLLLHRHAGQAWSARRVSDEIRTSEPSAAARLSDLELHGLLTSDEEGGERLFRFDPATEGLRSTVKNLADAYAERRYTVIDIIFSKPIDRLRLYADAFRIKKEDKGG